MPQKQHTGIHFVLSLLKLYVATENIQQSKKNLAIDSSDVIDERAARGGGGGGVRCQTFSFSFFPYSADHERDWPPCKVVFFGLATNALNVRNNM